MRACGPHKFFLPCASCIAIMVILEGTFWFLSFTVASLKLILYCLRVSIKNFIQLLAY